MKKFKRALSIALSLALMLNVFGILSSVYVSAEGKGSVTYDGAASDSSVYGKYFTFPNGCDAGKTVEIQKGYDSLLDESTLLWNKYNGSNEHIVASLGSNAYWGSEGFVKYGCSGSESTLYNLDSAASSAPFDFIFCLKNEVTPKAFTLINRTQKQFQPAYYELYASNDPTMLFDSSSFIATYDRTSDNLGKTEDEMTDRQINLIEMSGVENVRYFAVRMKYSWPVSGKESSNDFRALKMLLLGDKGKAVENYVAEDNAMTLDSTDLLTVQEAFPGSNTIYNIANAYDGNVETEASSSWVVFADSDGTYYTDGSRSVTVGYDFGAVKNINKIAVYNHVNDRIRTYWYELYAANDKDSLYNEEFKIATFKNDLRTRRQIFTFDNIQSRYVGIKVLNACCDPWSFDVAGMRLCEFAVYGTDAATVNTGKSYYNDFESVKNYTNETWKIEDTGDAEHGKALTIPRVTEGNWMAVTQDSVGSATYIYNRQAVNLFKEKLSVGSPYIFQYDMKIVEPENCGYAEVFHLVLNQTDFNKFNAPNVKNSYNHEWNTRSVGFNADNEVAGFTLNNCGRSLKAYLDNFALKQAVTLSDESGKAIGITNNSANTVSVNDANNVSGKTLLALGETVSFKLKAGDYVEMDGQRYDPDDSGIITIATVTGNVTVKGEKIAVSFYDKAGTLVYSVSMFKGESLTDADIAAAASKLPDIFGYNKKTVDGAQAWDNELSTVLTFDSDTSFSAIYEKDDATVNTVSMKKVSGGSTTLNVTFDQRFVLTDDNALAFLIDGKVAAYGKSMTLYGCGNLSVTATNDAQYSTAKPEVTILASRAINQSLTVFAYVYTPNGANITASGVKFASGATYDSIKDLQWNDANTEGKKLQNVAFTKSGNYMMITLFGITTEKTVRRAAQAYATVDGAEYYSNSIVETFNG